MGKIKMIKATVENIRKYNFTMSLENTLENNVKRGNHAENVEILESALSDMVRTLAVFGNAKMAQEMVKKFGNYVEFHAMNYHKPRDFYHLMGEVARFTSEHYASMEKGIEICQKLVNIVGEQSQKDCQRGCCKYA